MATVRDEIISIGERLPAARLEAVAGEPVDLQRSRHGTSVLLLPHPDCRECRASVERLGPVAERLRAWGGRLLLVAPPESAASVAEWGPHPVLVDADGRVRAGVGAAPDEAAMVVADAFGTVYRSASAGAGHDLPEPDDVLEEVRFMGSQCPECGVPDDPLAGEESWGR